MSSKGNVPKPQLSFTVIEISDDDLELDESRSCPVRTETSSLSQASVTFVSSSSKESSPTPVTPHRNLPLVQYDPESESILFQKAPSSSSRQSSTGVQPATPTLSQESPTTVTFSSRKRRGSSSPTQVGDKVDDTVNNATKRVKLDLSSSLKRTGQTSPTSSSNRSSEATSTVTSQSANSPETTEPISRVKDAAGQPWTVSVMSKVEEATEARVNDNNVEDENEDQDGKTNNNGDDQVEIRTVQSPTSTNTQVRAATKLINSSSYNFAPNNTRRVRGTLRPIIIDGSNVAMAHGNNKRFSCRGIQLCCDYFLGRGHSRVVAFVPQYRHKRSESVDTYLLDQLQDRGILKFTPSREVGASRFVPYDDRYIIQYAHDIGGIIVSNDNYRDLYTENPIWRDTIRTRVLSFTFADPDYLMFPSDPLGRYGPLLDQFLRY